MVIESKINSFIGDLKLGVSFFQSAGDKLVSMMDQDPRVLNQILDSRDTEWVTMDVLLTLEAIGRKQITPEALLLPKHVLQRVSALPPEEQLKIVSAPIPVAAGRSVGRHCIDMKQARDLNRAEAVRVIGNDGVRTPEQQIQMMQESQETRIGVYELSVMNGKVFVKKMPDNTKANIKGKIKSGKLLIELVS